MSSIIYDNVATYLRNNRIEEAFEEFSYVYGVDLEDKEKVLYDDMVLLLFSLIMDLDDDYMYVARNIKLDKFNSNYDNTDINNKLIRSIYNRDFKDAIYNLIDSKERNRNFTSKEAILLELLNLNRRNEKKYNRYIQTLIDEEDYDFAIISLKSKKNVRGLSKPERTLLYALNDLNNLKTNQIIPDRQEIDSRSVMNYITNHNYYKALYLQEEICNKKGIKLSENNLYTVISSICSIISDIDDEGKDSVIHKETDSLLIDPINNDNIPTSLKKTNFLETTKIKKKVSDQFIY